MKEQKNNGRGIFYGVIGVATLVVAIIGATFAYFTATASNNNVITGNMATINFGLSVTKVTDVDETKGGMIPMSNIMVEEAVNDDENASGQTCVDDNGNAVCQVYKIVVTNTGTASLFLDGYVTLTGGSGVPTDYTTWNDAGTVDDASDDAVPTTMRWAQVACTGDGTGCSTVMVSTTGATGALNGAASPEAAGIDVEWASLGTTSRTPAEGSDALTKEQAAEVAHDLDNIKTTGVTATGYISGNTYDIINTNYIRVSDHLAGAGYDRDEDVTSALVFNQYLDAKGGTNDDATFYFVVWLSETGTNQTAGSDGEGAFANEDGLEFFQGNVTFNSAQGSEVTATFSGYTAVQSDNV